jgi:hypothetical protein
MTNTIKSFLGPAMMFVTITLIVYVLPRTATRYYQNKDSKSTSQLESHEAAYVHKTGMLCSSFDQPKKSQVQFFGTVLNKDIKPGMALSFEGNMPWTVKAIYLDRHNPDETSNIAAAHTKDAAIVVETNQNFDKKLLKERLNTEGVVYLKFS